jgi:ornithine carbamoyltransferase
MQKIFCAVLALLATTACTIAPEKPKAGWSMATSGEQYERLLWDSVKTKNWSEIEAHLSGTVVTQTPDAIRNKQQSMEHMRQLDLKDYSIGDIQTATAGADIIVSYTFLAHGTLNGQPLPDKPMRMMTVWQQTKRGMTMAAHTTMPASP